MGVQGFTNYIKKKTPRVGIPIDILDESTRKKIIIGLDGLSYIFHVANQVSRCNSLKLFGDQVRQFFKLLKENQIECIVFMDGFEPLYKKNEHNKRFVQRSEQYTTSATQSMVDTQSRGITYYQYPSPLFSKEFTSILKELNVPVYVSRFEADRNIAQWAADNDNIFGIISNDSDFFFYQNLNCYFFPLDQISMNPQIKSIVVVGYTIERTANSLGIKQTKLPLLASLIGNDQTKHIPSNKNFRPKGNQDRVHTIVNLVKNQNCTNAALTREIFFISAKNQQVFIDSMKSYSLDTNITQLPLDSLVFEETTKTIFRDSNDIKIKFPKESSYQLEDSLFSISGHTSRIYCFSKLIYKEYHTHRNCFEPTMPYENSIITYMRNISAYFYGLLDSINNREGSKIEEMQPNLNEIISIIYTPTYLSYSHEQCYNNLVSFNRRIFDFCSIFNSIPMYNYLMDNDQKEIDITNFNFYQFYFINSWRYILTFKKFLFQIEEWMIETFIIQTLLLQHNVPIEFPLENDSFQPLYLAEFYQLLLRWCFDISDAMGLPKTAQAHRLGSTKELLYTSLFFETTYIHPLWRMAKSNYLKSTNVASPKERIEILFKPIVFLITPEIIQDFTTIKTLILKQ